MKDLVVFSGRRIARAKAMSVHLDVPKEAYAGLNAEEVANARESVERDAVYLQGLADGLRLATLVFNKEGAHI